MCVYSVYICVYILCMYMCVFCVCVCILYMYMCIFCVCMCIYFVYVGSTLETRGRPGAFFVEVKLQVILSYPTWC